MDNGSTVDIPLKPWRSDGLQTGSCAIAMRDMRRETHCTPSLIADQSRPKSEARLQQEVGGMTKRNWLIAGIALIAFLALGANYGAKISGAYGEVTRVQLKLDETNARVDLLDTRVKELENGREIDQRRIGELEAKLNSK